MFIFSNHVVNQGCLSPSSLDVPFRIIKILHNCSSQDFKQHTWKDKLQRTVPTVPQFSIRIFMSNSQTLQRVTPTSLDSCQPVKLFVMTSFRNPLEQELVVNQRVSDEQFMNCQRGSVIYSATKHRQCEGNCGWYLQMLTGESGCSGRHRNMWGRRVVQILHTTVAIDTWAAGPLANISHEHKRTITATKLFTLVSRPAVFTVNVSIEFKSRQYNYVPISIQLSTHIWPGSWSDLLNFRN